MPRLGVPSTTDSAGRLSKRHSRRKVPVANRPPCRARQISPSATIARKPSPAYRFGLCNSPRKRDERKAHGDGTGRGIKGSGLQTASRRRRQRGACRLQGQDARDLLLPPKPTPPVAPAKPLIFLGFVPISRRRARTF